MARAVGRVAVPALGDARGDGGDVGGEARLASLLGRGEVAEGDAQLGDAVAGARADRDDAGLRNAVALDDSAQRVDHVRTSIGGQQVDLVEHDEGDGGVLGVRGDELGVQHLVGVLLRVDDPDEGIHLAGQPFGDVAVGAVDGVEVGQVEQQQLCRRAGRAGASSTVRSRT